MTYTAKTYVIGIFWVVLGAGLGALSLSAANFKSSAPLKGIVVNIDGFGNDDGYFMKPTDIEHEIVQVIGSVSKHTVGDVSCDVVEDVLSKNPFISKVDVYVSGNGQLTAHIAQRKPILRVMSNGHNFYLDTEGKRMPVSTHYTPHVHVLTGAAAEKHAEDVLDLVQHIRDDEFMNAFVGQLDYPVQGEVTLIPTVGHAEILFGTPDRIAEKFENLKAFYSEVITEVGWDQYRTIDLRFRDQIICKKNPTS